MKRIIFLFVLCTLAISSCKKGDDKQDCAGIYCDYSGLDLRFRLVDAAGKNLVYGPDARILPENISLAFHEMTFEMHSSADSANATGYLNTSLLNLLSVVLMNPAAKELGLPLTLKVKTAAGENTILLNVEYGINCCGYSLRGLYLDKAGTFYKPQPHPTGAPVINIPIQL
ncbi:hypothetical protein [Chitinophaga sp. sic0106]|uniref:hypothetical protein n=1 Tax=Chitinophaga sp. sic0106 TaxID=2854785 RepID=UPI001C4507A3|nr:hypothetical protein [Chitinophaga sp. sic0106]MBV7533705.1 hypothetical protein [Chitinophaga sp. sic0106]